MAQIEIASDLEERVKAALAEGLAAYGINTIDIEAEETVFGKKRRFLVVSPDFKGYSNGERQDIVWRIIEKKLPTEDYFNITMILTFTPDEMDGNYD